MKKTLMIFLLVLVVLGGGAYYLVTSRVIDQLEQAQQQLAPIGTLQHGAVRITPGGTLQVHQLAFYPHGNNDVFRIERASLVTDSIFTLMQVASVVQRDQVPEALRFELRGVKMDFRGDWMATLADSTSSETSRHLYAAGCAERDYFSFADLDQMGYQNPRSDMSLEYRWSQNTSRLLILGELSTERMYEVAFNLDIAMQEDANDPMAAMMATQLRRVEFSYTNLGFTDSVIRFCAQETGLDQESYLQQHADAWEALWLDSQIRLGDGILEGYREFMLQPERLTVEAFPGGSIMELAMAGSPEAILDQLSPQITVNGGTPRPVNLAFLSEPVEEPAPAASSESGDEAAPETGVSRNRRVPGRVLSMTELGDFLDREVYVRLNDGRRYEGAIIAVEGERIQLRRTLFNGQMVMPVPLTDIGEVRLKWQQ